MIDIHAHILPGMDDGAEDLQDALEMAKIAVENGITSMVATPHCNIPGVYDNYLDKRFADIYKRVCDALEAHEIPLQLLPGMEVFATPDLPELLKTGKILTLNGSPYSGVASGLTIDSQVDTSIPGTYQVRYKYHSFTVYQTVVVR